MVRRWFYIVAGLALSMCILVTALHRSAAWSFAVVLPIVLLGLYDSLQRRHTILRNFPVLGHLRYLLEMVRPEIQQYFIESNIDAFPIEREMRALVYKRAKTDLETQPFGTQRDVYRVGYEWVSHSMRPVESLLEEPRLTVGGKDCSQPYSMSRLNIGAMSFGALSSAAVRALNQGAKIGNFAHNTGEGGISPYHLSGGDLIWQIGTAYFGCRTVDGRFDPERFAENAQRPEVKMIEIKLSQGAKPSHGGVLPGSKVTAEIAQIRHVPVGETVVSPARHTAFTTPVEMMEFVAQLRELSGGKPIGIKLCVGRRVELLAICKAMLETGIAPDFITVDGGEGGTGAAPLEFSNSIGMPARDGWAVVHSALLGSGMRDKVSVLVSGKIFTGFHMVRAMALGADACYSARGMMLALGCIQALRCNNNTCPTGVATQNQALVAGLDVTDKTQRVAHFHKATIHSFLEILSAIGTPDPRSIRPEIFFRRISDHRVRSFAELFDFLAPGCLLDNTQDVPLGWRRDWELAQAQSFQPRS